MSDHDFEKRVKQKMDELRFSPSDAVWTGVSREIRKDHRGRRGWFLLSLILMGLGVAGYFIYNSYNKPTGILSQNTPVAEQDKNIGKEENGEIKTSPGTATSEEHPSVDNNIDNSISEDKSVDNNDISALQNAELTKGKNNPVKNKTDGSAGSENKNKGAEPKTAEIKNGKTKNGEIKKGDIKTPEIKTDEIKNTDIETADIKTADTKITRKKNPDLDSPEKTGSQIIPAPDQASLQKSSRGNPSSGIPKSNINSHPEQSAITNQTGNEKLSTTKSKSRINESEKTGSIVKHDEAGSDGVSKTIPADSLLNDKNKIGSFGSTTKTDKDPTANRLASSDKKDLATATNDSALKMKSISAKNRNKLRKWEWGFTAGVGIANMTDGFLENVLKKSNMADAAPVNMPVSNYVGAPNTLGIPPPMASEVKPGPYFSAGGFLRRRLSKRFSVSTGLQFSQYNYTFKVGYRVDSSRLVNSGTQVLNVVRYYRANQENKFSNRYYFLELPVSLHTQLNRSERYPIIWNIDLRLSQLLGSNSLIFDSGTGVYYRDKSIYHKTQFGLGTGFSIGVLSNTRTPVWIGPSVKYNSTKLLNKEVSGEKHLFSGSLDLRIFINKK